MTKFPEISYLLNEKRDASTTSIVKVLKKTTRQLFAFCSEDELIFLTYPKERSKARHLINDSVSIQEIKESFQAKNRNQKPQNYWFIKFNDTVLDFCFNINADVLFVLTSNGDVWLVSIDALFSRCFQSSVESDIFADLLPQNPSNSGINISSLKSLFLTMEGGLVMNTTENDLFLLSACGNKLNILVSSIKIQSQASNLKQTKQLFDSMPHKHITLYFLSANKTFPGVITDQKLFSDLFLNQLVLTSFVCLFSTDGCLFYVSVTGERGISDVHVLCELKQPLKSLSSMTVKNATCDSFVSSTCYDEPGKAKVDKAIESFCDKAVENNILLLVGVSGKTVSIFNDGQRIIYFGNQLPSPVKAITTSEDIIILSDLTHVYMYKMVVKVHLIHVKGDSHMQFHPGHILQQKVPIINIEAMCNFSSEFMLVYCINTDKKVMEVQFQTSEYKPNNGSLETVIKQLQDLDTELINVENKSSTMNLLLLEIQMVTVISYALQRQVKYGQNILFDVHIDTQLLFTTNEQKLLVNCDFVNDSMHVFHGNWSITIKCQHKYLKAASTEPLHIQSQNENIPLPSVQSKSKCKFDFLINSSWLKYSPIVLHFYLNFTFEDICNRAQIDKEFNSVSFYIKSHEINVIDFCKLSKTASLYLPTLANGEDQRLSRDILFFRKLQVADGQQLLKQDNFEFCVPLTPNVVQYIKISQNSEETNIKLLIYKYLLHKECDFSSTNSSITLNHVNGEEAEIILKERDNSAYDLYLKSNNLPFLASLHSHILSVLQECPTDLNEDDDCSKRLQELSKRCTNLEESLHSGDADSTNEEFLSELMSVYTELRCTKL
ncbi:uncharacterized protein LOC130612657 [Hydractinia symbiolongicarpus]|uniref:uncharacterized protein LOC130612657 n=1 Tax=Hydractinia symbiolongicarpus TaxID=13093 RepID=UPI00254C7E4E|nr:uncharacterized protein LOC130612657 [Hydractinia symbiolongicarpus]